MAVTIYQGKHAVPAGPSSDASLGDLDDPFREPDAELVWQATRLELNSYCLQINTFGKTALLSHLSLILIDADLGSTFTGTAGMWGCP